MANASDGGESEPIEKRGDRVEALVSDGESITVPNGVFWVVSLFATNGASLITENSEFHEGDGGNSSTGKASLHEGRTIEVIGATPDHLLISGWEVEY